jgi:hypothetical protein
VATSRKRPQPTSTKSQKRNKIDVGEDGKPEPGPGHLYDWKTLSDKLQAKDVSHILSPENYPRPTSAEIYDVLEGECAGRFYVEQGWKPLASKGEYSFMKAFYRCDCANATSSKFCAKVRVVCRKKESSFTVDYLVQKTLAFDKKFCQHIVNGKSLEVAGKRIV